MTHACPVRDCAAKVRLEVFMCARHWRLVPRPLQAAVYESYRTSGRLSDNHREAVRVVEAAEQGRAGLDLPAGTKALTVWQPWASLIVMKVKPYEFRRWNFADKPYLAKLIGQRIVIHAGAHKPTADELEEILWRIDEGESALLPEARPFVEAQLRALKETKKVTAPLQAALGTAVLGEPVSVMKLFAGKVADSGRLDEHMYAWPMLDVRAFPEPVPTAGAQGFWNFT
jgi:hypothetical protein